jgi:hypothetical protein
MFSEEKRVNVDMFTRFQFVRRSNWRIFDTDRTVR